MALETSYQNTDVVLTERWTRGQRNLVKYFKCLTWILVTLYLVTVSLGLFLLLTILTLAAYFIIVQWVLLRPQILLNTEKRVVEMRDSIWFWKRRVVHPKEIQRIAVSLKTHRTGRGGEERLYRPQIILKNPENPAKRESINCFPLDDIVEAHYVAQVIAAFTRARAYDIKGNVLPMLRNYIPTKYLAGVAPVSVAPTPEQARKVKARATA
jgi:hypothetical protein